MKPFCPKFHKESIRLWDTQKKSGVKRLTEIEVKVKIQTEFREIVSIFQFSFLSDHRSDGKGNVNWKYFVICASVVRLKHVSDFFSPITMFRSNIRFSILTYLSIGWKNVWSSFVVVHWSHPPFFFHFNGTRCTRGTNCAKQR